MKKRIFYTRVFITVCVLSFSLSVHAQKPGGAVHNTNNYDPGVRPESMQTEKLSPEERAKIHTTRMKKDLKLTAEQEKKIGEINLKYANLVEEHLNDSPEMTDYDKAVLNKIINDQSAELKAELTEEQWTLFLKKQKDMKEKRGENLGQWQSKRQNQGQ